MMLKMLFRTAPPVVSFISRSNRRYLQIHQSDILQRIKCIGRVLICYLSVPSLQLTNLLYTILTILSIDRANNVAVVTVDGEPITFKQLDNASSLLAEIIERKTMASYDIVVYVSESLTIIQLLV